MREVGKRSFKKGLGGSDRQSKLGAREGNKERLYCAARKYGKKIP